MWGQIGEEVETNRGIGIRGVGLVFPGEDGFASWFIYQLVLGTIVLEF